MSLIIRDDRQPLYPDLRERIKVGDELLVVVPGDQRGKIEDRPRAVASVVDSPPLTRRTNNEFGGSTLPTATRRLCYHGWFKEPRAASSSVATSFRVGEMAAELPD